MLLKRGHRAAPSRRRRRPGPYSVQSRPMRRRDLLDDPPVLPGIAGRRERRPAELHAAVGVGEGAGLLGEGRGRQDHVGVEGRLGQEDVLHDQVLELGERLAGVVEVGVGHRRVLAHDVHAADLAGVDRVHDLDDGQARLRVERLAPEGLEQLADLRRSRPTGSRDRPSGSGRRRRRPARCSGRAAGAGRCPGRPIWPVISASAIRQRAVVGAVDVLADAHAPEDDARRATVA